MDSKDIKKYELMDIKTGNTMPVPATQELEQSLLLQHERLKKHGLQVEVQEEEVKPLSFIGGEIFGTDEMYLPGCFERNLKRITKYTHGNEEVVTLQDQICQHFYVMDISGENRKVSSMDVVYENMSYDRSKEYINNISFKRLKRGVNLMSLVMLFLWAICMASGCLTFALFFARNIPGWASIAIVACVISFNAGMALTKLYERKWTLYHLREKSRKVVEDVHKEVPDFCMEKLVALMDSRFHQIIYGEKPEEFGTFLDCDISGFRKDHENVINMERTNFWLRKYYREGDYQHLNILQSVYITEYKDNAISREVKDIRIQLTKPINSIMSEDFYQDWYVTDVEVVKDLTDEYE